jgi:hypothetical protein
MKPNRTTALHEAAHAVALLHLTDNDLCYVTILPEYIQESWRWKPAPFGVEPAFPQSLGLTRARQNYKRTRAHCIMALAGPVMDGMMLSEGKYWLADILASDESDIAKTRKWVKRKIVKHRHKDTAVPCEKCDAEMKTLFIEAADFIDQHWKEIRAVADALCKHWTLNNAAVVNIIEQTRAA